MFLSVRRRDKEPLIWVHKPTKVIVRAGVVFDGGERLVINDYRLHDHVILQERVHGDITIKHFWNDAFPEWAQRDQRLRQPHLTFCELKGHRRRASQQTPRGREATFNFNPDRP
jgi:hypothetical protein